MHEGDVHSLREEGQPRWQHARSEQPGRGGAPKREICMLTHHAPTLRSPAMHISTSLTCLLTRSCSRLPCALLPYAHPPCVHPPCVHPPCAHPPCAHQPCAHPPCASLTCLWNRRCSGLRPASLDIAARVDNAIPVQLWRHSASSAAFSSAPPPRSLSCSCAARGSSSRASCSDWALLSTSDRLGSTRCTCCMMLGCRAWDHVQAKQRLRIQGGTCRAIVRIRAECRESNARAQLELWAMRRISLLKVKENRRSDMPSPEAGLGSRGRICRGRQGC